MFAKNVGSTDRMIRLILGAVCVIAFFMLSGALAWIALIAGIVLLATGAMNSCGLYSLLGISTCKIEPR